MNKKRLEVLRKWNNNPNLVYGKKTLNEGKIKELKNIDSRSEERVECLRNWKKINNAILLMKRRSFTKQEFQTLFIKMKEIEDNAGFSEKVKQHRIKHEKDIEKMFG